MLQNDAIDCTYINPNVRLIDFKNVPTKKIKQHNKPIINHEVCINHKAYGGIFLREKYFLTVQLMQVYMDGPDSILLYGHIITKKSHVTSCFKRDHFK